MSLVEIVQINHYSEQYSNVISGNSTKERKYQRGNQKTHVKERHNDEMKEDTWTKLQMIYKTLHRKPMIE
jgi:hypothetical protein